MTDKELKEAIKSAYILTETDAEKRFIKKHEQRKLRLGEIIKIEFRYMGIKSLIPGAALCLLMMVAAGSGNTAFMLIISWFIPLGALMPMALLSRSEHYHMDEIEAASRFSLKFVRLVRMLIMGAVSMVIVIMCAAVLKKNADISIAGLLLNIAIPYFMSVWGGLLIVRKWHGRMNILGPAAVCVIGSMCSIALESVHRAYEAPAFIIIILTAAVMAITVKECIKFVKESENFSWNLC